MGAQSKHKPSSQFQSIVVWGILVATTTVQASFIPQYLGQAILFISLISVSIYTIQFYQYAQIPLYVFFGLFVVVFIQISHLVLSPTSGEILRVIAFPTMLIVVIIVLPQLVSPVKFLGIVSRFASGLVILGLPTLLLSNFGPVTPFIPPSSGGTINTTALWPGGPILNTVTSVFRNPNTLGIVAATGLMTSLVRFHSSLRREYILFGLLCTIGILVSNSTAALIGAVIFVGVYLGLYIFPTYYGYLIILSGVVIPPVLFVFFFSELSVLPSSISLSGRTRLWRATLSAVYDSPLFGYGAQPASQVIEPYLSSNTQAPHTSMVVFLSSGVIGGIAYFSAIYHALRTSFISRNERTYIGIVAISFGLLAIDFFHGFSIFGFSMGTFLLGSMIGYASIPEDLRSDKDA
jgi:hypothetical protein